MTVHFPPEPHDTLLFISSSALLIPILLIIDCINSVHLPVTNYIRIDFVIVKMLIINTMRDFIALWNIVDLLLNPLLILKIEESEVIQKLLLVSVIPTMYQHESTHN